VDFSGNTEIDHMPTEDRRLPGGAGQVMWI
jgi:hypothetical protein